MYAIGKGASVGNKNAGDAKVTRKPEGAPRNMVENG
jgi:hypothetical protein